MRFSKVISDANNFIKSAGSYPKRRRTKRLYKQWIEKSGLHADSIYIREYRADNSLFKFPYSGNLAAEECKTPIGTVKNGRVAAEIWEASKPTYEPKGTAEKRKVAVFMLAEINKEQLRLPILLVLLGASLVIFCLGVILLIVSSFGL